MSRRGFSAPGIRPGTLRTTRLSAVVAAIAVITSFFTVGLTGGLASPVQAAAPAGAGFTVTAGDLSFILKQIKIAERHASTLTAAKPCDTLVNQAGDGIPDVQQVPDRLTSYGLRTVDGSCNNLFAGRNTFAAADQPFPRLTSPVFRDAEPITSSLPVGAPGPTSYRQKRGNVVDSQPRLISNLIVDQTSTNPAAVAAAEFPVRTQGNPGLFPCTTDPAPDGSTPGVPVDCVPSHQTLFIPNVTTDTGLSPPYNSMFTFFGQFFDHGVDQTVKSGATVFVPLKADDPLIAGPDHVLGNADDLPANQRFMVLTRAQNQPGPDGILGDNPATPADESADDVQDATNTDSPWVDQSQTYSSHASHQVFLRAYDLVGGVPIANGHLLGGLVDDDPLVSGCAVTTVCYNDGHATAGSIGTWAATKKQAAQKLGLLLTDRDVTNIPMLATDPYGEFVPGPHGLPQYVTRSGLVEGNLTTPVPVPADVRYFDTPFLTDIAHNADPSPQSGPGTCNCTPTPDTDFVASADFASQPAGTYDDEMLADHFVCGDGRCNENIALSTIHQVFHSEHDRLVDDIQRTLDDPANAALSAAFHATNPVDPALAASASNPDISFGYGGRLFQAARFVTEMEYQHLVFEEFARKVQPAVRPFHVYSPDINPAVDAEFAHAVYRFGHSMLDDTVARTNVDPATGAKSDNSLPLLTAFLNPPAFFDGGSAGTLSPARAAGSIAMGSSSQVGNELDEFVGETLRNNLLGLPLDLATLNLTRARDAGVPPLNEVRRQINATTNDAAMAPYTSWSDFGQHLKHPESLVNFVAAYGTHPSILAATTLKDKRDAARAIVDPTGTDVPPTDAAAFMFGTVDPGPDGTAGTADDIDWSNRPNGVTITGLDSVDLWIGGLAELTNQNGGLLGSTFNYVFQTQLEKLQDGDRFYYLARTPGMNLRTQLESNSFAEMIQRNTDGTDSLKADAFATADCRFQLANINGPATSADPDGLPGSGDENTLLGAGTVNNDKASPCNENKLLLLQPNGTVQYRAINSVDPSGINGQAVYNGTPARDRIYGGVDNDTFWGGAGPDVIEGNNGDDVALGGDGNDIITDLNGADVHKGGGGNDAIDTGPGDDISMGGDGQDFLNGGANDNESFAGPGNDFVVAGQGADAVFGDGGDDWIQGGSGQDLLQGDHGAPFFDDPAETAPGNDLFIGQVGENDYDAEGGDDVMSQNVAVDRNAGAGGFDWAFHQYDNAPATDDMMINNNLGGLPIQLVVNRDRWQETEADSGGPFNDTILGTDGVLGTPRLIDGRTGGFTGCDAIDQAGLDRISGLAAILPPIGTWTGTAAETASLSTAGVCPLTGPVWGDGDILLGGPGADTITGRTGNEVIDGDQELRVAIAVMDPAHPGTTLGTTDLMEDKALTGDFGPGTAGMTLQQAVFAGLVDPGNLVATRAIVNLETHPVDCGATTPLNCDVAAFAGARGQYTVTRNANGSVTVVDTTSVPATVGAPATGDGTDLLWNVEKLRFSDTTVDLVTPPSAPVIGTATPGDGQATVSWTPGPAQGSPLNQFQIQVLSGGTLVRTVTGIAPLDTSRDVLGLTNGTTYTFRVVAVNQLGLASAPSAESNAVTPSNPNPRVVSSSPTDGATGVAVNANLTATFSKPVTSTNFTAAVTLRNNATGTTVGRVVTYDAPTQTVTVDPNVNLAPNTSYTLTLSGTGLSGIRDLAGVRIATTTITFTTVTDATAPTVTTTTPANGATNVGLGVNTVVNFSETVLGLTGTNVVLRNTATNTVVAAALTVNTAGTRVTINPVASLARNTVYQVTLLGGSTAIRDAAGNPLTTTTFSYRTRL